MPSPEKPDSQKLRLVLSSAALAVSAAAAVSFALLDLPQVVVLGLALLAALALIDVAGIVGPGHDSYRPTRRADRETVAAKVGSRAHSDRAQTPQE
jgi:hypothetical protein